MNTKVWYLPYFEGVYHTSRVFTILEWSKHTRMWMHVWYVWFILWSIHCKIIQSDRLWFAFARSLAWVERSPKQGMNLWWQEIMAFICQWKGFTCTTNCYCKIYSHHQKTCDWTILDCSDTISQLRLNIVKATCTLNLFKIYINL